MLRNIALADNARAYRIVNIVVDIGNAVGKVDNAAFRRTRLAPAGMADNAVAHLARKVQILEHIHNAQTLLVVPKTERTNLIERRLSGVTERRVPEIMSERDRFGQILIESKRPRDCPRNLRDLERVRQPSTVVVALRRDKYLRLVAQPPERLRVDNAVAVALKAGAVRTRLHRAQPACGAVRKGRPRLEHRVLALFVLLSNGHMYRLLSLGESVT